MRKAGDRSVGVAVKSEEDGFGRCFVEGDATLASSERRRRGTAFGFSILIETAALALLVIAPLMTSIAKPIFTQPAFTPLAFGKPPRATTPHNPNSRPHRPGNYEEGLVIPAPGHPPARPPQEESESDVPIYDGRLLLGQQGIEPAAFLDSRSAQPPPTVESSKTGVTRPLKVSGGIEEAQLISRVEPRYPQLAVITKREGAVVLHAIISRDGRIDFLEVVSGPPLLVQAALGAVRQWRYRPTLLNGEPVEVETTITVNFRLHVE